MDGPKPKESLPRDQIRKRLKLITPVGGSYLPPLPKPIVLPEDFPSDYPKSLILRTKVIVAEVVNEFSDRSKLEPFCKEIVSRLTELLCEAVREGTLKGYAAPYCMKEYVRYLCLENCDNENEQFLIRQAVCNSDEWREMERQLAVSERASGEAAGISPKPETGSEQIVKGRPKRRCGEFDSVAGELWRTAKGTASKVSTAGLKSIAAELDRRGFTPPADYLESEVAAQVKRYNSNHSNSSRGCITTWSALVAEDDKDHLRGMRRLLSRCAASAQRSRVRK